MPNLLSVLASPRGDYSVSNALTAKFVDAWKQKHSDGHVVTRDLYASNIPFVSMPWIAGAYTPPEQHSPEMKAAIKISDELVAELLAADHIVIGAPMYNFATPAILKAWIDHIVRINVTFNHAYEGLVKGKKVTVIVASGSVYTAGSPTEGYNNETGYLKQILGFMGMTDVQFILAGGTSGVNTGKLKFEDVIAQFEPEVVAAVS